MARAHGGGARGVLWAGTVLLLLPGIGCGPRVGHVSGRVLYNDRPLPSGTVLFVGVDGTRRGFSPIAADGTYRIQNIPVGPVKVAVVSEPRVPPGLRNAAGPGSSPRDRVKDDHVPIPPRYGDAAHSDLTYTVAGGRQTQDILLKP
jgi:hypothetical protein